MEHNVLYIKATNNRRIIIRENIDNYIYYITSLLIEKSLFYSHNVTNEYSIILKKSKIEEYLPNIIGNLRFVEFEVLEFEYLPPESTPIPISLPKPIPISLPTPRPIVEFNEGRECPICLENKNNFNETLCHHLFCVDCVSSLRNNRCPLCRHTMF
jgi:hypothetical protein